MVTPEDFKATMYSELQAAISREDEDILNDAIATAEIQAQGYLSRYDIDTLFARQNEDRDRSLVMYICDIAAWNFIALANANVDLQLRRSRYEDAIKDLEKIQSGKIVKKNWPLPVVEDPQLNSYFHVSSSPKRPTRW